MIKQKTIKLIALLLVMTNILFLSGCWDYNEMDDQLNVAGIGIDFGNNGQKYHVTAEVLTEGDVGEEGGGSKILETNGNTIFEAVRKLITLSSKKLYFGHCKIVIIGEQVAKKGMSEVLDLLVRDHEVRMSMNVLISKNCKAKEIFETKSIDDPIKSYHIAQLITTSERSGARSLKIQINEIYNMLHSHGKSVVIPAFELYDVQGVKTFKTEDFGVFKQDELIGYLNQDDRKIYTMVTNERDKGIFNLKLPNQEDSFVAFEMHHSKSNIKPLLKNGKLSFDIKVKCTFSIGEVQSSFNVIDKMEREDLKELLEDYLEQRIKTIILKSQQEFNCDIVGLGHTVHLKETKLWQQYKDDWCSIFPMVPVNVSCDAYIRDSGAIRSTMKVRD